MSYAGYLAPYVATIRELHGRGASTREIAEALYEKGARARSSDPHSIRLTREHHLVEFDLHDLVPAASARAASCAQTHRRSQGKQRGLDVTKSSPARVARRRRGAPPSDDQAVIDAVAALQVGLGISETKALDLAIALLEARQAEPSKVPRRRQPGTLVGYETRHTTVKGRASTVRKKLRSGAKARPERVLPMVLGLRSKDRAEFRRRVHALLLMPEAQARAQAARLLEGRA